MFAGIISIPIMTYYMAADTVWGLGYGMCQFWLCLDYMMCNASVLNLLLISFDRYFSVTGPLTYRPRFIAFSLSRIYRRKLNWWILLAKSAYKIPNTKFKPFFPNLLIKDLFIFLEILFIIEKIKTLIIPIRVGIWMNSHLQKNCKESIPYDC